jgi:hypothetical protein
LILDKSKIYEIDIKSVIRSFDYGRLMNIKSNFEKLNKDNTEKFMQFPEDKLILDEESNPILKKILLRNNDNNDYSGNEQGA